MDTPNSLQTSYTNREEQFRWFTETTTDLLLVIDQEGTIQFESPSVSRFTGTIVAQKPYSNVLETIHEDDLEKAKNAIAEACKEPNTPKSVDLRFHYRDGTWRILRCSGTSSIGLSGKTEIAIVAHDITDSLKQNEQLLAMQKRYEHIIEQSPYSVVVTDKTGAIEYVNPIFCIVTGYSREEAIGQNPRILKSGMNDPSVYDDLWKTLTSKQIWHGELCNKNKSGEIYWELATIFPLLDDHHEIEKYAAIKENITERKIKEEQLRLRTHELEVMNNAMIGRELKMIELKKEIAILKATIEDNRRK